MALTNEERNARQRKWRASRPGYSTEASRKWRMSHPEKYKAIYTKYNRLQTGNRILESRKRKITSNHAGLYCKSEVVRLLSKAKDPIDIAMWLKIPVSIVMGIKESLAAQPNV